MSVRFKNARVEKLPTNIRIPLTQKVKRSEKNMVQELITFRITKAKFGVKYLCGHECERSSAQ